MKVIFDAINAIFTLAERCDSITFNRYKDILKFDCRGVFVPAPVNGWRVDEPQKAIELLTAAGFEIEQSTESARDISKDVTVRFYDGFYRFKNAVKNELYNMLFRNGISGLTEFDTETWERKTSSLILAEEIIEKLKANGFNLIIDASYEAAKAAELERRAAYAHIQPELARVLNNEVKPFAHQNRAYEFLTQCGGIAILGACMGSGKTFMALSYAAVNRLKTLVICPKVVRRNWCLEAEKFFTTFSNTAEIKCKKDLRKAINADLVSINYELAVRYAAELVMIGFDLLIVDESHYIKNPKSQRYCAVSFIAKQCKHRILLSGTIVKNGREELLPQLQVLGEEYVPHDFWRLPLGSLWHEMQSFYLSMPKHEILSFLPPKIQRRVELEVDEPVSAPESLEDVTKFKHLCAQSKIEAAIDYINDWLESSDDDDAMIVFSEFIDVVTALHDKFAKMSLIHTGEQNQEVREKVKEDFQNGKAKILFATRPSLAVGANLTRANRVMFVDLPWTPADIEQAEDRAHRIGQVQSVSIDWLVARNSEFDMKLIDILHRKLKLAKAISEGRNLTDAERKLLETSTERLLAEAFGLK